MIGPIALVHKFSSMVFGFLKPFGIWGLGGIAFIDSALIPIPVTMDGVVVGYTAANHHYFLLYSLMAAAASAVGSLVPFFVGRAGGEIFLLKRINRERYQSIRDRFERQEFLAIMIPAMLPPPTPLKLFEFAAGVFEMKPVLFLVAIFCGKFAQFLVCAVLTLWFGPTLLHTLKHMIHHHFDVVLGLASAAALCLIFYIVRRIFDRRKGERLPLEEDL
jgi:membrane protein YqaA with SNARE-associated domain